MHVEHTVHATGAGARLVDYLKDRLVAVPVTEIGHLITTGRVRVVAAGPCAPRDGAGAAPERTDRAVRDGDRLLVDAAALEELRGRGRWTTPWARDLAVLDEDDDLVVVDKPAGLHVHPLGDRRGETLVSALLHRCGAREDAPFGSWRPHVAQRLDCVVSGVVVVAKGAAAKAALVRQQKAGAVHRVYVAVVEGDVAGDAGVVDAPVGREPGRGWRRAVVAVRDGGQEARTRWRVVSRRAGRTLVEVEPETGRTHQIRVHLASMGHPIAGDRLYGATSTCGPPVSRDGRELADAGVAEADIAGLGDAMSTPAATATARALPLPAGPDDAPARLGAIVEPIALHAARVTLRHPGDGTSRTFQCAPPRRFAPFV